VRKVEGVGVVKDKELKSLRRLKPGDTRRKVVSRGEGSGEGEHAISLSDTLYPYGRAEAGEDAAVVLNKSTSNALDGLF
jgi:hypothetical protein